MKSDYANGDSTEQYTARLKSSPAFMSSRQIASYPDQQGINSVRTYRRNTVYSEPRRNNYLHLPAKHVSNVSKQAEISPTVQSNSFAKGLSPQPPLANNITDPGRIDLTEEEPPLTKNTGHKTKKRIPFRGMTGLVLAVAILALVGPVFRSGGQQPFSKQLASAVNIKLYYPSVMPHGYHVITSSIKMTTSQSMHFEIASGKNVIQIDESQAESGPDIARVLQTNFQDASHVKSNYGNAVVGFQKNSKGIFGSLVSKDGSWIIATGNSDTKTVGAVATIMSSLSPV